MTITGHAMLIASVIILMDFGPSSALSQEESLRERLEDSAAAGKGDWKALIERPIFLDGEPGLDDACGSLGEVVGLDPRGDGFLAVRSRPDGREVDRLLNGQSVLVCEDTGRWIGIAYPEPGQNVFECNDLPSWTKKMPYTGPCRYGWVFSKYVRVVAG